MKATVVNLSICILTWIAMLFTVTFLTAYLLSTTMAEVITFPPYAVLVGLLTGTLSMMFTFNYRSTE